MNTKQNFQRNYKMNNKEKLLKITISYKFI